MYTSLEINEALRDIYKVNKELLGWIFVKKDDIDFDSLLIATIPPISMRRTIVPFSYFEAEKCYPGYVFDNERSASLRCFAEFFINNPCEDNVEVIRGLLGKVTKDQVADRNAFWVISPGMSKKTIVERVERAKKEDAIMNKRANEDGERIPIIVHNTANQTYIDNAYFDNVVTTYAINDIPATVLGANATFVMPQTTWADRVYDVDTGDAVLVPVEF